MPIKQSCNDVVTINSARHFFHPAPILRSARVSRLLANPNVAVLELGGGCLRNALYLQSLAIRIHVVELPGMEVRFPDSYRRFREAGGKVTSTLPRLRFDIVLATFVIETICNPHQRTQLIRKAHRALKKYGNLVLSARGPRDHITSYASGRRLSDGYITPGKSFSRSYTPRQLSHFLASCGFTNIEFLHKRTTAEPEYVHLIANKKGSDGARSYFCSKNGK
jgi:hypothetical protein